MYNDSLELITIDDMCEILLIGRNSAYDLLNTGKIKAFKIGSHWKLTREAVEEFIRNESHLSK